jgi:hypothetical protein
MSQDPRSVRQLRSGTTSGRRREIRTRATYKTTGARPAPAFVERRSIRRARAPSGAGAPMAYSARRPVSFCPHRGTRSVVARPQSPLDHRGSIRRSAGHNSSERETLALSLLASYHGDRGRRKLRTHPRESTGAYKCRDGLVTEPPGRSSHGHRYGKRGWRRPVWQAFA